MDSRGLFTHLRPPAYPLLPPQPSLLSSPLPLLLNSTPSPSGPQLMTLTHTSSRRPNLQTLESQCLGSLCSLVSSSVQPMGRARRRLEDGKGEFLPAESRVGGSPISTLERAQLLPNSFSYTTTSLSRL